MSFATATRQRRKVSVPTGRNAAVAVVLAGLRHRDVRESVTEFPAGLHGANLIFRRAPRTPRTARSCTRARARECARVGHISGRINYPIRHEPFITQ